MSLLLNRSKTIKYSVFVQTKISTLTLKQVFGIYITFITFSCLEFIIGRLSGGIFNFYLYIIIIINIDLYIYIYIRRYNEETKLSVTPSFVLTHSSDSIISVSRL